MANPSSSEESAGDGAGSSSAATGVAAKSCSVGREGAASLSPSCPKETLPARSSGPQPLSAALLQTVAEASSREPCDSSCAAVCEAPLLRLVVTGPARWRGSADFAGTPLLLCAVFNYERAAENVCGEALLQLNEAAVAVAWGEGPLVIDGLEFPGEKQGGKEAPNQQSSFPVLCLAAFKPHSKGDEAAEPRADCLLGGLHVPLHFVDSSLLRPELKLRLRLCEGFSFCWRAEEDLPATTCSSATNLLAMSLPREASLETLTRSFNRLMHEASASGVGGSVFGANSSGNRCNVMLFRTQNLPERIGALAAGGATCCWFPQTPSYASTGGLKPIGGVSREPPRAALVSASSAVSREQSAALLGPSALGLGSGLRAAAASSAGASSHRRQTSRAASTTHDASGGEARRVSRERGSGQGTQSEAAAARGSSQRALLTDSLKQNKNITVAAVLAASAVAAAARGSRRFMTDGGDTSAQVRLSEEREETASARVASLAAKKPSAADCRDAPSFAESELTPDDSVSVKGGEERVSTEEAKQMLKRRVASAVAASAAGMAGSSGSGSSLSLSLRRIDSLMRRAQESLQQHRQQHNNPTSRPLSRAASAVDRNRNAAPPREGPRKALSAVADSPPLLPAKSPGASAAKTQTHPDLPPRRERGVWLLVGILSEAALSASERRQKAAGQKEALLRLLLRSLSQRFNSTTSAQEAEISDLKASLQTALSEASELGFKTVKSEAAATRHQRAAALLERELAETKQLLDSQREETRQVEAGVERVQKLISEQHESQARLRIQQIENLQRELEAQTQRSQTLEKEAAEASVLRDRVKELTERLERLEKIERVASGCDARERERRMGELETLVLKVEACLFDAQRSSGSEALEKLRGILQWLRVSREALQVKRRPAESLTPSADIQRNRDAPASPPASASSQQQRRPASSVSAQRLPSPLASPASASQPLRSPAPAAASVRSSSLKSSPSALLRRPASPSVSASRGGALPRAACRPASSQGARLLGMHQHLPPNPQIPQFDAGLSSPLFFAAPPHQQQRMPSFNAMQQSLHFGGTPASGSGKLQPSFGATFAASLNPQGSSASLASPHEQALRQHFGSAQNMHAHFNARGISPQRAVAFARGNQPPPPGR